MISNNLNTIFQQSILFAKELRHEYLTTEHLFYMVLSSEEGSVILEACGANIEAANLGCIACQWGPCGDINKIPSVDEKDSFDVQFLVGIERYTNSKDEAVTEEISSEKLELVILKAIEVFMNEIKVFGVNGETNIQLVHKNFYLAPPDGEIDIQMQVDLVFEQERFLCH